MLFLSVFIGILKYTAIIFVCVLVFLLFILFFLLAAPVSYKSDVKKYNETSVMVKARWLYGIVGLKYTYLDDFSDASVFIFRRRLKERPDKNEKSEKTRKRGRRAVEREPKDGAARKSFSFKKNKKPASAPGKDKTGDAPEGKRNALAEFIRTPDKKVMIEAIFLLAGRLIKKLKPKYFYFDGEIGFDSPHLTGYALAFAAVLQGLKGANINLSANMNESVFNCRCKVNGRFTFLGLCVPFAVFIFSSPGRKIIKLYRNTQVD